MERVARPSRARARCMAQAVLAGCGAFGFAPKASAMDAIVHAQSELQLYSVRSPYGPQVLQRQRLIHQLALDALGAPPTADSSKVTWAFHSRLRLDGDYGITPEERDPSRQGSFTPGLATSPVDLSYGYLSVTGLLADTTALTLGRQLTFNSLGFWSYDGAQVAFVPGGLFELSLLGGWEQRGGVPLLSTSRYEADGVFRGNREGMSGPEWPSYLSSTSLAPAVGATFSWLAFHGLRARVDYRRVTQSDRVVTLPFADASGKLQTFAGRRISSEKVGVGAGFDLAPRASVDGAWVFDLYQRKTEVHRATANYRPSEQWRLGLGYNYRLPLFDADSIFNWFGARGNVSASATVTYEPVTAFQITATCGMRWLGIGPKQLLSEALSVGPEGGKDALGRLDTSYFGREFTLGSGTLYESGDGGTRYVADVYHRRSLFERKLLITQLVSAGRWQNPWYAERGQSSLMYVLGARLYPGARQEFGIEWEHVLAQGPLQHFRVLATAMARFP